MSMEQNHAAAGVPRMSLWIRLPVLLLAFLAVDLVAQAAVHAGYASPVLTLLVGLAVAGLALWAYRRMVVFLERRRVSELDGPWGRRLAGGVGAGVALFAVTIAVIAMFGGYRVAGAGSVGGAVTAVGVMAVAAVCEELLFRGVLFRLVHESFGAAAALTVSAVVFGGLHLLNPRATVWGGFAIAVEAGLMLGAAYLVGRSLWLPIGLHFGWNFAEGGLFGTTVSGSGDGADGLLRGVAHGPAAISGGEFGPEASVFAIVFGLTATVVLLAVARRHRAH